tara:strand:+ start:476 stop:874 length:399 start_codon:yes stop_codon:yes gene_type:complete
MNKRHLDFIAWGMAVVYLWFGVLKIIPGASPAEELVASTVGKLSFGLVQESLAVYSVGFLEIFIALILVFSRFRKFSAVLVIGHLFFTFTPILLFPEKCFSSVLVLTLLGQYVIKNIILSTSAFILFEYSES